jgi:hypothetical protein
MQGNAAGNRQLLVSRIIGQVPKNLCGHPKLKIHGKWNQSLAIQVQEGVLGSLAQASVYF